MTGSRKKRKGFLLSLDAIIAIGLILTLVMFLSGLSFTYQSPELKYQRLYYTGKDTLMLLENARIEQLQDFDVIQYYQGTGILTQEDQDKTILDIMGSFWATDNATLHDYASNITGQVLNATLPPSYSYSVILDDDTIYQRDLGEGSYLARLSTIVSGIQRGEPVEGYLARAWASKIKKNTTDVIPFHIEGAGNMGGKLEIWKRFNLNAMQIINATFYISAHYGASADEFENLFINGNNVKNRIDWIHEDTRSIGTGAFGVAEVTDVIVSGDNEIYLRFKNNLYNSHIHPGMRLEITYQTEEVKNASAIEKQRVYFDHIVSNKLGSRKSGIWALVPFYIPRDAVVRNVTAHIRAEDIDDVADRDDVNIYFNDSIYTSFDAPPSGIVDVTYNFTNMTSEGTNWVLVQLNYRITNTWWGQFDDFKGEGETILYSDPMVDPDGSSYIEFEYEVSGKKLYYGYVDVTLSENMGGPLENPKLYNITFDGNVLENVFEHVAQLFSDTMNISVWPEGDSPQLIFTTPVPRAIPSSIYIDPSYFNESGNNFINTDDVCEDCYILPESSLEYALWIPSSVGYGLVNETEQGALDDAIRRLNGVLGKYAVATSIETEVNSVSGVPSMWGPVEMEVRVWN